MNALLGKILDAHGGVERWERYTEVKASIVSGGGLFAFPGGYCLAAAGVARKLTAIRL
jgi:hypothetical protein